MRKLYMCPNCGSEHSGIPSAYEDGGGAYGEDLTPIFDCPDCGKWFTDHEGFYAYDGSDDVIPDDDEVDDMPTLGDGGIPT